MFFNKICEKQTAKNNSASQESKIFDNLFEVQV
jgi:hypothetical protein